MEAIERLVCERAYILSSLCNIHEKEGISGFRFKLYSMQWKIFLYAARDFEVYVDGKIMHNSGVTIGWNNKSYPAEHLAGSDCIIPEGEVMTISVEYPGGLDIHCPYEIFVRFMSRGDYGRDGTGRWVCLAAFSAAIESGGYC